MLSIQNERIVSGDSVVGLRGLELQLPPTSLRFFTKEARPEIRGWGADAFEPVREA